MAKVLKEKLKFLEELHAEGQLSDEAYATKKAQLLAASSSPLQPELATLPSILALPLESYWKESHPVIKLWAACDVLEILLRLLVFLGLADLQRGGPLSRELRRELKDQIERPTLGNWRRMAQQVANALTKNTLFPELPSLLGKTPLPLLDGKGSPSSETSFLALRNRLAHGGGLTRRQAEALLRIWQLPFETLWGQMSWLAELHLLVRRPGGDYGCLRGLGVEPVSYTAADPRTLAQAFAQGESVVAERCGQYLSLWPLTLFGPPRMAGRGLAPADIPATQVYVRRGQVRLQYTPVGNTDLCQSESDEAALECFLGWFQAGVDPAPAAKGFTVQGFENELRQVAQDVVGREEPLARVRQAISDTSEGWLCLWGVAGVGKSYLMARIAHEILTTPPLETLVLPYRFRKADARCSRETFLRYAVERLTTWLPEPLSSPKDEASEQRSQELPNREPPLLKKLRQQLTHLAGRRVLFLLDGLDEIAERDPNFAAFVPLGLAGPGVTWLCAGRPERGLPEDFDRAGAKRLYPDHLPPMSEGEIRTLLLERIGPLRKRLLKQDQEQGEAVSNAFVDKVTRLAKGLPLYVKFVIDDIWGGRYRVLDVNERLPPGLSGYYDELLQRCRVGPMQQTLTPLAATLAAAREPLSIPALADLLYQRGELVPPGDGGYRRVAQALAALEALLARFPTPEGEAGYRLYHHSLTQYMANSADYQEIVAVARRSFRKFAKAVTSGPAAPYLYRQGISHLLESKPDTASALGLLTSFDYLMARLRTLKDPEGVNGISADWRATISQPHSLEGDIRLWEAFWREREHILSRGDERWPAYKILLQLAVEHADDSPITRQAEVWLAQGRCDWVWLRNPQRVPHAAPDPCLRVFEGHTGGVLGALELRDGRLLSWSGDKTLRLWDGVSGAALHTLEGHTGGVNGTLKLRDGRLLSWSGDKTLRLWDGTSGVPRATVKGHTGGVNGTLELRDGRLLSWSGDKTLRLWDGATLSTLEGDWVHDFFEVADGRLLYWSEKDNAFRMWDSASGAPLATLRGHTNGVEGALELQDGRLLSWSKDKKLRLWDGVSGAPLAILKGHTNRVTGALELRDGRLLSWSGNELRLWDGVSGAPLATLEKHANRLEGALDLRDGRLLSWSRNELRLWDGLSGATQAALEGHNGFVRGALELRDGRLLSWSWGGELRLWDGVSGAPLAILKGHTNRVTGALELRDGRLLSWSDSELRLWDGVSGAALARHIGEFWQVLELRDWRVVAWSTDELWLWDGVSGAALTRLYGGDWLGALELRDGRLLFWSLDELHLLDGVTGKHLISLVVHADWVTGALELRDGRLLSWSDSELRLQASSSNWVSLEGHNGFVQGALELRDGRLLSWSWGGELRLWDGASGAALGGPIPKDGLLWQHPDLFFLLAQRETPTVVASDSVSVWFGRSAVVMGRDGWSTPVCWQSSHIGRPISLSASGKLWVTLDSGHVFCLQLYQGSQRINLADYETSSRQDRENSSDSSPQRRGLVGG